MDRLRKAWSHGLRITDTLTIRRNVLKDAIVRVHVHFRARLERFRARMCINAKSRSRGFRKNESVSLRVGPCMGSSLLDYLKCLCQHGWLTDVHLCSVE